MSPDHALWITTPLPRLARSVHFGEPVGLFVVDGGKRKKGPQCDSTTGSRWSPGFRLSCFANHLQEVLQTKT